MTSKDIKVVCNSDTDSKSLESQKCLLKIYDVEEEVEKYHNEVEKLELLS